MLRISEMIKGRTPAYTTSCGCFVIPEIAYMVTPNGGEIIAISTIRTMSTPNQMGSRPAWVMTGKKTVMK